LQHNGKTRAAIAKPRGYVQFGDCKAIWEKYLAKLITLRDTMRSKHLALQLAFPRMRPRNEAIWLGGTSRVVG
jgi:hypothetical protein